MSKHHVLIINRSKDTGVSTLHNPGSKILIIRQIIGQKNDMLHFFLHLS